jgi:sigma-B regulation protein RsbU (phosphoserine phosphatase)
MNDELGDGWNDLRAAGLTRRVARGETVFAEGDQADGAYVLLDGDCAVLEGDDHVATLQPGELFGEIATFDGGRRTATVLATVDSEVLFLSLSQLQRGFIDAPDMFWRSLRLVVGRLRVIAARQAAYRAEHKALREVQRSLLPDVDRLDGDAGFGLEAVWEPCTYASGDYYDFIRLDADRHLVAIGDVMGHGAEASLMMAIARAELHELARRFRRTDELLLSLDGYLRDNAPPKQGMSLFVGVFDRRERLLEFSTAGHPLPLLCREGVVTDLPGRAGILLGLPFIVGAGYERNEVELERRDRLLLFTDGAFEITTAADDTQLGRGGLAELFADAVRRGDGLAHLARRIAELDAAPAADDDRTVLLLDIA